MHKTLAASSAILAALALLLAVSAEAASRDYAVLSFGCLVKASLSFEPGGAWSLGEPMIAKYSLEAKPLEQGAAKVIAVALELEMVAGASQSRTQKLLGLLKVPGKLEGAVVVLPPPELVDSISPSGSAVLVTPRLILSVNGTTKVVQLAPLKVYVKPSETVVCGKCVVDLSRGLELCAAAPREAVASSAEYDVRVELRSYKVVRVEAVAYAATPSGSLLASKTVEGASNYLSVRLPVPLDSLTATEAREMSLGLKGLAAGGGFELSVTWPLKLVVPSGLVSVDIVVPQGLLVEGGEYEFKVRVESKAASTLVLERVEMLVNGVLASSKPVAVKLPPGGVEVVPARVKLPSGAVNLTAVAHYLAAGKRMKAESSTVVSVERALHLDLSATRVPAGGELTAFITPLREVELVKLVAVCGNETHALATVQDLKPLRVAKILVKVKVGPGKCKVRAVTPEGLESNEVNLEVTEASKPSSQPSAGKQQPQQHKPGSRQLKVVLLPSAVSAAPSENVRVSALLTPPTPRASVRLYREEPKYSPPWVLVPGARVEQVTGNEYRISFRAPEKPGNYTYKVVVEAGDSRAEALLHLVVSQHSARTPPTQTVLPLELFVPVVCTAAAGSVLLYRRKKRK